MASAPILSFPAGDVVRQGYLFVKRPPRKNLIKLRAWHGGYFVLRDETQEHCALLEMYEKNELLVAPLGLTVPKIVIDLGQCVHIGFSADSTRFMYTLVIVCKARTPMLLASEDELSARSWLLALALITHKGCSSGPGNLTTFIRPPRTLRNDSFRRLGYSGDSNSAPLEFLTSYDSTDSLLPEEYAGFGIDTSFAREIFAVTTITTESSIRLKIKGEILLVIFSYGVGLAKPNKSDCFLVWPVAFIRQYQLESASTSGKSKATILTLDVGRRSTTGEGIFQFRTQRGQDIIRELKKIVELWSERKTMLSIQQSTSKQSLVDCAAFSRAGPSTQFHRCQLTGAAGCSAPCTPSLAFPHNWQKRWSSPGPHKRVESRDVTMREETPEEGASKPNEEMITDSEVNYIVPAFDDDSCDDDDCSAPVRRFSPFGKVAKRERRRADGCCKGDYLAAQEGTSKDTCYVEIVREADAPNANAKGNARGMSHRSKDPGEYIEVLPT